MRADDRAVDAALTRPLGLLDDHRLDTSNIRAAAAKTRGGTEYPISFGLLDFVLWWKIQIFDYQVSHPLMGRVLR